MMRARLLTIVTGAAIGLLLAAPVPGYASGAPINPAAQPVSRMQTPWWRERFEAKAAEERGAHPALIFLGDSITENWEKSGPLPQQDFQPVWQRFYGDRHALNLGFKGDATAHLLWRMENGELDGITPRVAVVLIGANNFGHVHWNAAQTVGGIDTVIATLHRKLPDTQVILLSILPSERSAWITDNTAVANRMLAARYAQGQDSRVSWVDMTPVFAPGGQFQRDLFYDPLLTPPDPPLHPTAQGMGRMAAAMEPLLSRLLGDRNHASDHASGQASGQASDHAR